MSDEKECCKPSTSNEQYSPGWVTVTLAVSPSGEMHALGGERGPGDPNSDRAYLGLDRVNELYVRRDSINEYCQHLNNVANLESVNSRYRDLLEHLGVQGHDGAIAEIAALRNRFLTSKESESKKEVVKFFTLIPLDSNNRMLRVGFGKNKGSWFVRVDLWFKAFRLVFN